MDDAWKDMYRLDPFSRDRVIASVRLLLPHLKDGDVVVDVGCYTCEAKKYLPSHIKYIGIDFDRGDIQVDLDSSDKVAQVLQQLNLPIDAKFLCLETLEHLKKPSSLLENLKNSFYLGVISLPNESTLYHRLRCLFGTVDAECFSETGKHLHLPNLYQARRLLCQYWEIVQERYLAPTSSHRSRASFGTKAILSLTPRALLRFLANHVPSLFSRNFIFLVQSNKQQTSTGLGHPLSTLTN